MCGPRALTETAERAAARAAAGGAAEQALEQVAEVGGVAATPEVEILEARARLRPTGTGRIAGETAAERHLGISFFVDLDAVVARALILVGQHVVGVGHLAEALGGVRIVLVAVGVKLFGEAPIRLLDLGLGRAALQAQPLIKVECHVAPMPQSLTADQMGCSKREAKPKALAR